MREAGLDAIRIGILDVSKVLEIQQTVGLELVLPMCVVAAHPVGTTLVGHVVQTELGLDLLQSFGGSFGRAMIVRIDGASRMVAVVS